MNNIYKDMSELFVSDIFHNGGDEVNFRCWNETQEIVDFMASKGWDRNTEGFLSLWDYYQSRSLAELDKAYGKEQDVVFWTSELTADGHAPNYLNSSRYIIQFWEDGNDPSTKELLLQNYRLIMSNSGNSSALRIDRIY